MASKIYPSVRPKDGSSRLQANMPQYVKDSILRQYKGGKNYTIEDKKNVINWYSKIRA